MTAYWLIVGGGALIFLAVVVFTIWNIIDDKLRYRRMGYTRWWWM